MGSVLIGTVVSRHSDRNRPVHRLNNNLELGESVFDSAELQKESNSFGTKNTEKFEPELIEESVNIGKLARTNGRRVKDVEQVIAEVSHTQELISSLLISLENELLKPFDLTNCAFKNYKCATKFTNIN